MDLTGISYSLQPVSGNLDFGQARHLLDRCLFGAKKGEIDSLVGKPVTFALNTLLAVPTTPDPPISMDSKDLEVTLGNTWVNTVYNGTYNTYRLKSLRSWWIGLMMQQGMSLVEKMVLFWHNHFVTEMNVVNTASYLYQYNQLLRTYALGNIKQFVYDITVTPAMLSYLNGDQNKATAPNENFARELFELFTIGKGPLIADGNYTNYTEADIREAAKVLTGWKNDLPTSKSVYDTTRHDKTTKVFSAALGNTTIQNLEAEEYKSLANMIFSKKETARFFAREIYRWFMYYDINPTVEGQIIDNLATTLMNNNYEIKPLLIQLLSSEHFFSTDYRGSQIKNPLDFSIGIYRKLEIPLSDIILNNYEIWITTYYSCQSMEMSPGDPPDVSGWPQYYKEPAYYELWINSATVPSHATFSDTLCKNGITKNGFKYIVNPFILANKVTDPSDANTLINGFAQFLLPVSLSNEQITQLKDVLIPGLPDSTWTTEWNKYYLDQNNATQKSVISNKLLALLTKMLRMPEFYLS